MPTARTCVSSSRRARVGFASLMLGATLANPASALDVWVDFTSDFSDGAGGFFGPDDIRTDGPANGVADWIDELNEATTLAGVPNFTAAERQTIQDGIFADLNTMYAGTNVNFFADRPTDLTTRSPLARVIKELPAAGTGSPGKTYSIAER